MPPAKHLQDTPLMNTYEQLSSKAVKDTEVIICSALKRHFGFRALVTDY